MWRAGSTATVRDGPGWRAAAYLLVKLPVTVGEVYAAFFAAAGLANLTYPFWWPLFRNHPPDVRLGPVYALTPFGPLRIETFPGTFAAFAAGAAMVLAAPWAARAVSSADRWLMRGLLGRAGWRSGSPTWSRPGRWRWTTPPPCCAGSNAICTTARRSGWPPWP